MIDYHIVNTFTSFFQNPTVWGIGLAIGFGAVWLAGYLPPLFRRPSLWAILVSSAFLTLAATLFIQIPLHVWTEDALNRFWSQEVLARWFLLASIPQLLIGVLVQEGAKLVPVVLYWRIHENTAPKLGLAIGAVAGAGFAIFEAQRELNGVFVSGMTTWETIRTYGFMTLVYTGLWHTFFTVPAQIAFSALAGYGLVKGWGWQSYLIVSLLHGVFNYNIVLLRAERLDLFQAAIYVAVMAGLVTALALWLRWRREKTAAEPATLAPSSSNGEEPACC